MGRLPLKFAGKDIRFRIPYTMPGELVLATQAQGVLFADNTFQQNIDKPFEIHRMNVNIAAYTTNDASPPVNVPIGPQFAAALGAGQLDEILRDYVRLRIQDVGKNETINKSAQLVSDLVRKNTGAWEFEEPYTIVRSEGFTISVDTIIPANFTITAGDETVTVTNLRVAITFEGFLVIVAVPSETR